MLNCKKKMNTITTVVNSEIFKKWHKQEYLISYYILNQTENVVFYSKENKKATIFTVADTIEMSEDDLFQRKEPEELKLEAVNIDLNNALTIAEEAKERQLGEEVIEKKIIILSSENHSQWNITYITNTLKMLNIKINAIDGNIEKEKVEALIALGK